MTEHQASGLRFAAGLLWAAVGAWALALAGVPPVPPSGPWMRGILHAALRGVFWPVVLVAHLVRRRRS